MPGTARRYLLIVGVAACGLLLILHAGHRIHGRHLPAKADTAIEMARPGAPAAAALPLTRDREHARQRPVDLQRVGAKPPEAAQTFAHVPTVDRFGGDVISPGVYPPMRAIPPAVYAGSPRAATTCRSRLRTLDLANHHRRFQCSNAQIAAPPTAAGC